MTKKVDPSLEPTPPEYLSPYRGIVKEEDTDDWAMYLRRNADAINKGSAMHARVAFYSATPSQPKQERKQEVDTFEELPPAPPECRVIHESLFKVRTFEKESEYIAWRSKPWYKRLFS